MALELREILQYPSPLLLKESEDITSFDNETKALAEELISLMVNNNGIGLAAPQIGVHKNIIALRANANGGIVLINPKILEKSDETFSMEEGCLSVPMYTTVIERPGEIKVSYFDIHGEEKELMAEQYASSVIQHEVDHLFGKLIID